jgi:hypothetical protein
MYARSLKFVNAIDAMFLENPCAEYRVWLKLNPNGVTRQPLNIHVFDYTIDTEASQQPVHRG